MPYPGNPATRTAGNQPAQNQSNPSSFLSETQGLLSSNNPSYQGAGVIAGGQSAGIAQSGLTMEQLLGEVLGVVPATGVANQEAADQYEFGMSNAKLTQGGDYLQGLGLQAQGAQLQAQQGFTTAEYNLNAGQYPEQLAEAAQQNKTANQNIATSGAAAGDGLHPGPGQCHPEPGPPVRLAAAGHRSSAGRSGPPAAGRA
jgi:hypothetical protein